MTKEEKLQAYQHYQEVVAKAFDDLYQEPSLLLVSICYAIATEGCYTATQKGQLLEILFKAIQTVIDELEVPDGEER